MKLTDEQIAAIIAEIDGEIEIASIAHDGSISADWLAMTLAEDARIEGGRLANAEYLAVRIAAVSDEILARAVKAEARVAELEGVAVDVMASLAAAISLLERGGKKAAASDKMFAQMLVDYNASLDRARAALGRNAT